MHRQQEKIHRKVETSFVILQNLTIKNYSHVAKSFGIQETLHLKRLSGYHK